MTMTAFDKISAGLTDAIAIADGRADTSTFRVHIPEELDIKALRGRLGLTQPEFAARYGFEVGTLRNWEQRHRRPTGAARVLLTVIDRDHEAVDRALSPA